MTFYDFRFDRDAILLLLPRTVPRSERTVSNRNGHSYPILIVLDAVAALDFRFEAALISVRGANAILLLRQWYIEATAEDLLLLQKK